MPCIHLAPACVGRLLLLSYAEVADSMTSNILNVPSSLLHAVAVAAALAFCSLAMRSQSADVPRASDAPTDVVAAS
jgi:hypothetical protein